MTNIGDLTPNDIGNTELSIRHEGSTVTGPLMSLDIETRHVNSYVLCEREPRVTVAHVNVTITLGSITLGPLDRDHPCEVIA